MCVAIQEMMDESRAEGCAEGLEKGRAEMIDGIIMILRRLGVSEEDVFGQLKAQFDLTDEEIEKHLHPAQA